MKLGCKVAVDTSGFKFLIDANKRRDVTLKGVKAGAKIVQKAARAAAPKRRGSGALKSAQGVLAKKGKKGGTVSFAVQGVMKRVVKMVTLPGRKKPMRVVPAFYDHLVMGGVKAHSVSKGQSLGRAQQTTKKGRLFGKSVARTDQAGNKHPGSSANPYRKRAWNSVKDQVANVMLKAMAIEEERLFAKAYAKSVASLGKSYSGKP